MELIKGQNFSTHLKNLEKLAREYIEEKATNSEINDLVFNFIRSLEPGYTTPIWEITAGSINLIFKTHIKENYPILSSIGIGSVYADGWSEVEYNGSIKSLTDNRSYEPVEVFKNVFEDVFGVVHRYDDEDYISFTFKEAGSVELYCTIPRGEYSKTNPDGTPIDMRLTIYDSNGVLIKQLPTNAQFHKMNVTKGQTVFVKVEWMGGIMTPDEPYNLTASLR